MKKIAIAAIVVMVPHITFAEQAIYIDQAGENLNATITQSGGDNNSVGDASATDKYFYIDGDNITLTWGFTGEGNMLTGSISGDSFTYSLDITGDNNILDILATMSSSSDLSWTIVGNANEFALSMGQVVSAEYTTLTYDITGGDNLFDITIDADGATHDFTLNGDGNEFNITQTGYGNSLDGHLITIDATGDFNTFTILQETTVSASIIDMVTNGSNQVISITQSD